MTPFVPDQQVLAGKMATLQVQLRGSDGEVGSAGGTITVGVVKADGSEVLAAGTATSDAGSGVYTVSVPASSIPTPQLLTATWTDSGDPTDVVTYHEVVGGFYASVAGIKATDDVYQDSSRYPNEKIIEARRTVEAEFEDICGRAFVPRFRRVKITNRTRGEYLVLPDPLMRSFLTARVYDSDGTYEDVESVSAIQPDNAGIAQLDGGWPLGELVVEYVHGYSQPPADVLGAFTTRIRDVLNRTNRGVPDRTSSFTSAENGTFSLIVPGMKGSITGIPDVDVVLQRYQEEPGLA